MKERREGQSISDQLDALLIAILKECKDYEENKRVFMEVYHDVLLSILCDAVGSV